MVPAMIDVKADEGYTLHIVFENGEQGVLDMTEHLDWRVFRRLKDREAFRRMRVSFGTIAWDAGVDLDPEFVYEKTKRPHETTSTDN